MAKTQSEVIGLAIIMILIAFGLVIFISFSLRTKPQNVPSQYTYRQIPVLLNNAILETHTTEEDCYGEKIQKILISSADNSNLICKNNMKAEEFANKTISSFLNETLNKWGMYYQYTVYTGTDYRDPNNQIIFIKNHNCINMNIDTENFFFRMADGRFLNIKLDLCY
jgi:hypothetical protein